jgi:hypothetical protein
MRGELNRINPTVVEGAEDIFGADDRLIAAGSRPGFWSKRGKGKGGKLTPTQFSKLDKMNRMKKRVRASAETFNAGGCGCGGNTVMNAEGETGCGCGGNTAMGAEAFEARTYRKSPRRGKTPSSKGKTAGKMRRRRKMKQGYNDRMDESMGGGDSMDATRKARRDESKGMEKSMGNRAYSRVQTMDAQGYNDRMDESMGMSNGKESSMKQSMKDRRDESKGMEKSMGNRAYSRVQTMDAEFNAYDDDITERQEYLIEELEGKVDKTMNRSQASDYIKRLKGKKSGTWKDAENFGAESPVNDENMVNEGSVDAFYGGGRKVEVSGDGITPTANPSVDEAFNVGNDVGLDVSDQELMNVNPSVEVNYGADGLGETDVVSTVQNLTSRLGFRVNGLVASAIVLGVAGMAGYHYAKKE